MKKFIFIMVFMILMQPCLAAKVISTVSSTVESDVIGLTTGSKLASSAIILPNGTAYDSYTDDGLLITSNFDTVYSATKAELGIGKIVLRDGVYYHSKIVDVPQGITLEGESLGGVVLVPTQNVDQIFMHPGSSIDRIVLNTNTFPGYNRTSLKISSKDPWSDFYPSLYGYKISNIDMWGGEEDTAFLVDATGRHGYNGENGVGGYVCGIDAENVNFLGYKKGLVLRADTEYSFINGNRFKDFSFTGTTYSVRNEPVNGSSGKNIDGNIYENFHIQYVSGMVTAFDIGGRYNRISAMIWDWAPDTAVIFQKDSGQNYALLGVDKSKIVDNGVSELMTRNTIVGYI